MLNINLAGIPASMKADRRWVVYKKADLEVGKKVPYTVLGKNASSNDNSTWSTFEEVEAVLSNNSEYAAVGYSLKDSGLCVVDIDNHPKSVDAATMSDSEIDEVNLFNRNLESAVKVFTNLLTNNIKTYVERSISDRGTHVFIKGELLPNYETSAKKVPLEIYTANDNRFIVMTGVRVTDYEVSDLEKDVEFVRQLQKNNFREKSNNVETKGLRIEPIKTLAYDDEYVLRVALKDKKFSLLWNNSWDEVVDSEGNQRFASQHYADAALINKLVFYTKNCPEQVKRMFKASPTYKAYGVGDKAGKHKFESDIVNDTIKASENCYSVYDPKTYYEKLKVENPEEYATKLEDIKESGMSEEELEDLLNEGDLAMLQDFEEAVENNETSFWTPDVKDIKAKLDNLKGSSAFKNAMLSYIDEFKDNLENVEYIDDLHEIDKNVLGYAKLVKRVLGDNFFYSPVRRVFYKYNGLKYQQLDATVLPSIVIDALKEAKHSIFKYSVEVLDIVASESLDEGTAKYNDEENGTDIVSDTYRVEEYRKQILDLTSKINELKKAEKQDYKELAKLDKDLEKARKNFDKTSKELLKSSKEADKDKLEVEKYILAKATELWDWISSNKLVSVRNAEDIIKILKVDEIENDIMDYDDSPYINLKNGVLNLETKEIIEHSTDIKFDKVFGCNYNPDAKCPTFDNMLEKFQPDEANRKELLKMFGLTLAKNQAPLKKIVCLLFGASDTGKTTLNRAIVNVLGDYAASINPSLLIKSYNAKTNVGPEMLVLRDCLLLSMSETEENDKLDSAKVKALTGNTPIPVRNLYDLKVTEVYFKGVMAMDTNFLPTISAVDDGMWTRLKVFPFNTKIKKEEKDPNIFNKLTEEVDGIFNRMLEGYALLLSEGFTETSDMETAKALYKDEMSTVKTFIKECVITYTEATDTNLNGRKIRTTQMFETYCNWCEDNQQHVMKRARFFTEIDTFLQKVKTGGYEYFKACDFNALGLLYSKMKEQSKQDFNIAKNQLMIRAEQDSKQLADVPTYNSMRRLITFRTSKWFVDNLSGKGNLNPTFAKGLYINYVTDSLDDLQLPLKQVDFDLVVEWLYKELGNVAPIIFNELYIKDKISEVFSLQTVSEALDTKEVKVLEFGGEVVTA